MECAVRLIPRRIEPPIDLYWLADWFGIEIEIRTLPKEVPGFYFRSKRPYIFLNNRDTPERQRWSLAHELAHHMLHIGIESADARFDVHTAQDLFSEHVCNYFAAELLMPEQIVRRKVLEVVHGHYDKTALLANIFEVSITAMRIRLRELGLIYWRR